MRHWAVHLCINSALCVLSYLIFSLNMGRVFNFKLGSFVSIKYNCMACKQPLLKLKTRFRFCPDGLSLSTPSTLWKTVHSGKILTLSLCLMLAKKQELGGIWNATILSTPWPHTKVAKVAEHSTNNPKIKGSYPANRKSKNYLECSFSCFKVNGDSAETEISETSPTLTATSLDPDSRWHPVKVHNVSAGFPTSVGFQRTSSTGSPSIRSRQTLAAMLYKTFPFLHRWQRATKLVECLSGGLYYKHTIIVMGDTCTINVL